MIIMRNQWADRFARLTIAVLFVFGVIGVAKAQTSTGNPQQVFEQRILPIFKSPNPSSCVQCHLAGVDLKDYILPSHEKTFRSLRDQGLIDLDNPSKSKILKLIQMGAEQKEGAALISAKNRKAEFEAFSAWIEACCKDDALRNAPKLADGEKAGPTRPLEVVRFERKDRLLESFEKNVWSLRFRCMSCHTEGSPQNTKLREKFGERVSWMKKNGSEATMEFILQSKLIDMDNPEKSRLLLKPLAVLPHEGGKKFLPGDQGYQGFRTWIEDVVAIRMDKYNTAAELPAKDSGPLRFGSDIWLKITNAPPAWGDKLLRLTIFAWDNNQKVWEKEAIATSDRAVSGTGHLWQHSLTLFAAPGSPRATAWKMAEPKLPPGKYLVKVHIDQDGKLARDWKTALGDADYVGQAEFTATWTPGYDRMTSVDAEKIRR